jgi:hypothetical protein
MQYLTELEAQEFQGWKDSVGFVAREVAENEIADFSSVAIVMTGSGSDRFGRANNGISGHDGSFFSRESSDFARDRRLNVLGGTMLEETP